MKEANHLEIEMKTPGTPFRHLWDAWQDYLLGRLIRRHQISVMRIQSSLVDGDEWSSCDQRMSEDYGHGGKWGGGKTPLDAVKSILPNATTQTPT